MKKLEAVNTVCSIIKVDRIDPDNPDLTKDELTCLVSFLKINADLATKIHELIKKRKSHGKVPRQPEWI